jgi:putative phosphoribosyl transferase
MQRMPSCQHSRRIMPLRAYSGRMAAQPFRDRAEAGRLLAERLVAEAAAGAVSADAVVYGIPRGGVVVAAPVARALAAPLDVVLVRKLGAPEHQEYAVGAIGENVRVVDAAAVRGMGVGPEQLAFVEDLERVELARRTRLFGGDGARANVRGRTAIVVDDGIATGATVLAAIRGLRRREPRKIVLAVPVAPPDEVEELRGEVDDLICLQTPERFGAIGYFYDEFRQLSDEDVVQMMDSAREAEDKRKPI